MRDASALNLNPPGILVPGTGTYIGPLNRMAFQSTKVWTQQPYDENSVFSLLVNFPAVHQETSVGIQQQCGRAHDLKWHLPTCTTDLQRRPSNYTTECPKPQIQVWAPTARPSTVVPSRFGDEADQQPLSSDYMVQYWSNVISSRM